MKVRDLMVPVTDYPRVAEDRSIFDAFNILEAHRKRFARKEYRPRVVLVHDADFKLVGGLDHTSMMRTMGGAQKAGWVPCGGKNASGATCAARAIWGHPRRNLSGGMEKHQLCRGTAENGLSL